MNPKLINFTKILNYEKLELYGIYISLSMAVLNSRDWPKEMASEILAHPKPTLE